MKPLNSQKDYQDYVNKKSPNSPILKDCFCFLGRRIDLFNRANNYGCM